MMEVERCLKLQGLVATARCYLLPAIKGGNRACQGRWGEVSELVHVAAGKAWPCSHIVCLQHALRMLLVIDHDVHNVSVSCAGGVLCQKCFTAAIHF